MEYMIVESTKLRNLVEAVNVYLTEGFKPQGGVSIAVNSQTRETIYAQAMIKETV